MKIFAGGRGSGRTTALKEWAMEDAHNRGIIVTNYRQWQFWKDFQRAGGLVVDDVRAPTHIRGSDRLFGIDNAEQLLFNHQAPLDRIGAIVLPGELVYVDVRRMCQELQEIRSSCA